MIGKNIIINFLLIILSTVMISIIMYFSQGNNFYESSNPFIVIFIMGLFVLMNLWGLIQSIRKIGKLFLTIIVFISLLFVFFIWCILIFYLGKLENKKIPYYLINVLILIITNVFSGIIVLKIKKTYENIKNKKC
jgi:hypothetical protein